MPYPFSKPIAGFASAIIAVATIGTMVDVPMAAAEAPAFTILTAELA